MNIAFFKEWDINLGAPTAAAEDLGNGVYLRKFQKGYVYGGQRHPLDERSRKLEGG